MVPDRPQTPVSLKHPRCFPWIGRNAQKCFYNVDLVLYAGHEVGGVEKSIPGRRYDRKLTGDVIL